MQSRGENSLPLEPSISAARRVQHPWQEIAYRARDPRFVLDYAFCTLVRAWDRISPSEFGSLYRQIRTRTLCSGARLRGLHNGLRYVVQEKIRGDVVECGSALGGSAALMALTLRNLHVARRMWLFDTFEGLPAPTSKDPDFRFADLFTGTCVGTVSEVQQLFDQLGIGSGMTMVKGLFQETLPSTPIDQIAFLHIDGDWYESVKACLDNLYDKVVPGGVIQFDDYGYWEGTRRAVDEFLVQRSISAPLGRLDYSGRFLVKQSV